MKTRRWKLKVTQANVSQSKSYLTEEQLFLAKHGNLF